MPRVPAKGTVTTRNASLGIFLKTSLWLCTGECILAHEKRANKETNNKNKTTQLTDINLASEQWYNFANSSLMSSRSSSDLVTMMRISVASSVPRPCWAAEKKHKQIKNKTSLSGSKPQSSEADNSLIQKRYDGLCLLLCSPRLVQCILKQFQV